MSSDSGSGEYPRAPAQKARDENILGVLEATDDPVLTTAEVAEELPIGKRATLNRLEELVERGEVESKDVGVGRVWWRAVPDEPDPEPADAAVVAEPAGAGGVAEPLEQEQVGPVQPEEVDERDSPADTLEEDPRWAFIGSLGRHSIYAGAFLIGLMLTESLTAQTLLPFSVPLLFLTAVVFFLIGFPATAVYRIKRYLTSVDVSVSQLLPGG